jgi:hypothetical protein
MLESIASALGIATESNAIHQMIVRARGPQKCSVRTRDETIGRALEQLGYEVLDGAPAGRTVDVWVVTASKVDATLCTSLRDEAHGLRSGGLLLVTSTALLSRRTNSRSRFSALVLHSGFFDVTQASISGVLITVGVKP